MLSELPVYIACMCLLSLLHEYVYDRMFMSVFKFALYIYIYMSMIVSSEHAQCLGGWVCYNLVSEQFGFEVVVCPRPGWPGDVTIWYQSPWFPH
jgi:hypothetical protein